MNSVVIAGTALACIACCQLSPAFADDAPAVVERLRAAYSLSTPVVSDVRWAMNADNYERALDAAMLESISGVVGIERFQLLQFPTDFRVVEEGSLSFDGVRSTRIEKRSLTSIGPYEVRTIVELFGEQGHVLTRLQSRSATVTEYPWNDDASEAAYFANGVVTLRWLVAARNPIEAARYAAMLLALDPAVTASPGPVVGITRLESPLYALRVDVDTGTSELLGLANDQIVGPGLELVFVGHHPELAFPARWPRLVYTLHTDTQIPVSVVTFETADVSKPIEPQSFHWQSFADRAFIKPGDRWVTADAAPSERGRLPSPRLAPGSGPSAPSTGKPAAVAGPPLLPDNTSQRQRRYWLATIGGGLVLAAAIARLRRRAQRQA